MRSTEAEISEILKKFGKFVTTRWSPGEDGGPSLLSIQSLTTKQKYTHCIAFETKREILIEIDSWMNRFVKQRESIRVQEQKSQQK